MQIGECDSIQTTRSIWCKKHWIRMLLPGENYWEAYRFAYIFSPPSGLVCLAFRYQIWSFHDDGFDRGVAIVVASQWSIPNRLTGVWVGNYTLDVLAVWFDDGRVMRKYDTLIYLIILSCGQHDWHRWSECVPGTLNCVLVWSYARKAYIYAALSCNLTLLKILLEFRMFWGVYYNTI